MEKQNVTHQYWSMTEGAFNCLIDKDRTNALAGALKNLVKPGSTVVDAGTGTGILAMIAASLGAARVYAVEIDPRNSKVLEETFRLNGFSNIFVIQGDARAIDLPENVDVIISEMIATGLVEELQADVAENLTRFANENAVCLINRYDGMLDIVSNNNRYYGFDFNIIRYEYPDEDDLISQALTKSQQLFSVNFLDRKIDRRVDIKLRLEVLQDGVANGVRIWGRTFLGDGSEMGASFAYDYPIVLPINATAVKAGHFVEVEVSYDINGGFSGLSYNCKFE